jgi:hypothetical protein
MFFGEWSPSLVVLERFLALADQSPCHPQSLLSHFLHSWNKLEQRVITQDRGQLAGIDDRIAAADFFSLV